MSWYKNYLTRHDTSTYNNKELELLKQKLQLGTDCVLEEEIMQKILSRLSWLAQGYLPDTPVHWQSCTAPRKWYHRSPGRLSHSCSGLLCCCTQTRWRSRWLFGRTAGTRCYTDQVLSFSSNKELSFQYFYFFNMGKLTSDFSSKWKIMIIGTCYLAAVQRFHLYISIFRFKISLDIS